MYPPAAILEQGWPCLLVGPQSSGKTTVVTQVDDILYRIDTFTADSICISLLKQ